MQFELLNLVVELFGLASELHAPQFGDHQLQMLDLCGSRVQLRFKAQDSFIAGQQQSLRASVSLGRSAVLSMCRVYATHFMFTMPMLGARSAPGAASQFPPVASIAAPGLA